MTKIKPVLGRGLDALIRPQGMSAPENIPVRGGAPAEHSEGSVNRLAMDLIDPNPFQPRTEFEPEALEELKNSILANGLIQPVTVRKWGIRYQLVSGERRLRACRDIGYLDIPAYIIEVTSDEVMLAMALIENIQRERLNPIEVGSAYKRLMDECNLTQEQIAERVGKDRTTVANSIRLLKLPEEVRKALIREDISMGHARALINLPTAALQLQALQQIISGSLSVRKVENLVKSMLTAGSEAGKGALSIGIKPPASTGLASIEDHLRKLFGTKVLCKQKPNGRGEIVLEFYSKDEFERLLELFELIDQHQ